MSGKRLVRSGHVSSASEETIYEGLWWIPERPDDYIAGTLNISPDEGITLRLMGAFERESEQFNPPFHSIDVILGRLLGGRQFTLCGCRQSHRTHDGLEYHRYRIETALDGAHIPSLDQAEFNEISIRYTHLMDWLRNVGLGDPKETQDGIIIEYDQAYHSTISEIHGDVGGDRISIHSKPRAYPAGHGKVVVEVQDWIEVLLKEPMSINGLVSTYVEPLRDLVTFATVRSNSVTSFTVNSVTPGEEWISLIVYTSVFYNYVEPGEPL